MTVCLGHGLDTRSWPPTFIAMVLPAAGDLLKPMVLSFLKNAFAADEGPAAPPGERIYAIGDIHGRLDLLERLLAGIERDMAKAGGKTCHLVFLGDYVDRGPDSAGVIECLITLPRRFPHVRFLTGNHEEAMLNFMDNPIKEMAWLDFGGTETLESYRVLPPMPRTSPEAIRTAGARLSAILPASHWSFLRDLEVSVTLGDYFFVHAGIKPGVPLSEQKRGDLLWIREEFISSDWSCGKVVVHGHTPSEEPSIGDARIGIDTGAYATGRLTAVVLEGTTRRFLATSPRR